MTNQGITVEKFLSGNFSQELVKGAVIDYNYFKYTFNANGEISKFQAFERYMNSNREKDVSLETL